MCFSASKQRRPERMLRPSLSVAKKSFRHAQAFFRASKSSGKWGSSSCRTPFPGFPHTPFRPVDERLPRFGGSLRKGRSVCSGLPSAWRKSLFATLRHFSELQKALKNGDHPRAGHPSRVSRTHPSAPLTKGSPALGAVSGKAGAYAPAFLQRGEKVFSPR